MYPRLKQYVDSLVSDFRNIETVRQQELEAVSDYIHQQLQEGKQVDLNFICTHNSRRSHFGQIWASTAIAYYQLSDIHTYSGGTEATAFNHRSVAALERAGFEVKKTVGIGEEDNPRYQLRFAENAPSMLCFSKTYDDSFNPSQNFVAIMTCSHADENCPLVLGASKRFAITYEDPKVADDTPEESAKYDERCRQIATEMFYLFSKISL